MKCKMCDFEIETGNISIDVNMIIQHIIDKHKEVQL